jgi:hypothetical protein
MVKLHGEGYDWQKEPLDPVVMLVSGELRWEGTRW